MFIAASVETRVFFNFCQQIATFLLTATILLAPWLFGGALPMHQFWFAVGLCASLWICLLTYPRAENRGRLGAPLWLLLLALLFGGLQLVPLTNELHSALSPKSLAWWQELSGIRSSQAASRFPLSIYPAGTRADLALFALPAAALAITVLKFRRLENAPWLLGLVAFNGAGLAIFGIVQQLTSPDKLFWTVELEQGGVPFSAFVNRNHAAAYLNLCLACGLGFLIWVRERPKVGGRFDILDRGTQLILSVLFTAACATGVMLSLSRGAAVASLCGAVALLILVPRIRQDSGYRNTIICAISLGLLVAIWLGGGSALGARFQNLSQPSASSRGRLLHWQDTLKAVPDFWITGSGLGTYRYAYQPYEQRFVDGWFYHAENQYLEALVESGLPGLILMLSLMALLLCRAVHGLRLASSPFGYGVGVACVFGLTTTIVHAVFDFNLYLPAVSMLVAVLAGMGLCLDLAQHDTRLSLRSSLLVGALPLLLLCVWSSWSLWELGRVARIDSAMRSVGRLTAETRLDADWVEQKSQLLRARLDGRPDDAEAQVRYAEFLLAAFHSRLYDQLRVQAEKEYDESTLWKIADPLSLHEKYHQLSNPEEFLSILRENSAVVEVLQPSFAVLQSAIQHNPLMSRAHTLLARLSFAFESPASEIDHEEHSMRLRGFDPATLFQIGLLDISAKRFDLGFDRWRKCLEYTSKYDRAIVNTCLNQMSTDQFIANILPTSPLRAVEVADRFARNAKSDDQNILLAKAIEVLDVTTLSEAERFFVEATTYRLRGQFDLAKQKYEQAVDLQPARTDWRFELAKVLLQQDALTEAREHAAICSKLEPNNRFVSTFLERVNRRLAELN